MNGRHLRLSAWLLVLFTCFAFIGSPSAYAWDNGTSHQPRVEAAGWYCTPAFGPPSGCAEIKFGITAKNDKTGNPQGRFEYMNHFTGYSAKGRITAFTPHNATCADPFAPNGLPAATVKGMCDDGSCSFQMDVVDDDTVKHQPDWVCNVQVSGTDKKGHSEANMDAGEPIQHGNVEIHPE